MGLNPMVHLERAGYYYRDNIGRAGREDEL